MCLEKSKGSFTPSESCISLVNCQNPGDATFRVYIHVKITQGVSEPVQHSSNRCEWCGDGQQRQSVPKQGVLISVRKVCRTVCRPWEFWQQLLFGWPLCSAEAMCSLPEAVVPICALVLLPPMDRAREHPAGCRRGKVLTGQLFKDPSHRSATCLSLGQAKLKYLKVFLLNTQELLKADLIPKKYRQKTFLAS